MSTPTLTDLNEGHVVRNGHIEQLYDPADAASTRSALFPRGLRYTMGPLAIEASADLGTPAVTVVVTLLGLEIGRAVLTPNQQKATLGGAIAGFKAQLDLTLAENPLQLTVHGELCAPFAGCETFDQIIPL